MRIINKIKLAKLVLILIFTGTLIYFEYIKRVNKYVTKSFCPIDNVITIREGGRLGNCVWEYVSVMAIGESLGFKTYLPKSILDCLDKVFKRLRIPAYETTLLSETCMNVHGGDVEKCNNQNLSQNGTPWDRLCYALEHGGTIEPDIARKTVTELKKLKDSGKLPTILILPRWIYLPHVFDPVGISRFKKEFQLREDVEQLAAETIHGVIEKVGNGDLILVGVHVRRTDYMKHLQLHKKVRVALADLDYYKRAMNRMHNLYNYSKMVFTVVSDDFEWCKQNLLNEREGVFWGGLENSTFIKNWEEKRDMAVSHDLAVLSMQNHTIIGYGTFAATGSLLSGGHTIVTNISLYGKVRDDLATYLSNRLSNWEQL